MEHNMKNHDMKHGNPYKRLAVMIVLSFSSMYIFMYAMVDRPADVYPSFNQFYMAGLMTAPMVVIELALMGAMYSNKKLNAVLIGIAVVAGIGFFTFIRQQTAVTDAQFLKSMIPHHSGAILMCEQASIQDPEIKSLCKSIISGQQSEIEQMKALLSKHQ